MLDITAAGLSGWEESGRSAANVEACSGSTASPCCLAQNRCLGSLIRMPMHTALGFARLNRYQLLETLRASLLASTP